jgi:hypothetical protein
MIYKTLHRKDLLKIQQHEPYQNRGWIRVLRICKQFLHHKWNPYIFTLYLTFVIVFIQGLHKLVV